MKKRIKIFLDDELHPLGEFTPPSNFSLDTTKIPDGPHTLKLVATSSDGVEGLKMVDFVVCNGPEIGLSGLKGNDMVSEQIDISVNAYGSETRENFIVSGSETPSVVPAWLCVLMGFVAWAGFYLVSYWMN